MGFLSGVGLRLKPRLGGLLPGCQGFGHRWVLVAFLPPIGPWLGQWVLCAASTQQLSGQREVDQKAAIGQSDWMVDWKGTGHGPSAHLCHALKNFSTNLQHLLWLSGGDGHMAEKLSDQGFKVQIMKP
jgi:hypothetical protein